MPKRIAKTIRKFLIVTLMTITLSVIFYFGIKDSFDIKASFNEFQTTVKKYGRMDISGYSFCEDLKQPNWAIKVEPQIKLRSDRFIYPAVMWGPNNQIDGLLQTMYLAINLNRTLVLPVMFNDFRHDRSSKFPAFQRIDVERLRRFIPVIPVEEMRAKCLGEFDVAFLSHRAGFVDHGAIEGSTKMVIFKRRKHSESPLVLNSNNQMVPPSDDVSIPVYPLPPYVPQLQPYLPSDTTKLRQIFPSNASCAVHLAPFEAIEVDFRKNSSAPLTEKYISKGINVEKIPDEVLYSACADAIQHPSVIIDYARDFIKQKSHGKTSIFIHWRYDENDWISVMCNIPEVIHYEFCNKIKHVKPVDILNGITKTTENILKEGGLTMLNIGMIYFATPNSMIHTFVKKFKELAQTKIPQVRILTNEDLENFVDELPSNCAEIWESKVEFYSLLEMEISRAIEIFFYSHGSTWSTFSLLRRNKGKKFHVFSVADSALEAASVRMTGNP